MKNAKFGLILISALSVFGCDENDTLGSVMTSATDSLGAVPEKISMYTNASETNAELIAVKQQLKQAEERLASSQKAGVSAQSLQQERTQLQRELKTINATMSQVQSLKRQLANQDSLLMDLEKVLSSAEVEVAALKGGGAKGATVSKRQQQRLSISREQPKTARVNPRSVKPALKTAQKPAAERSKQLEKTQRQKKLQQLRRAQQQKKIQQAHKQQQMKQAKLAQAKQAQASPQNRPGKQQPEAGDLKQKMLLKRKQLQQKMLKRRQQQQQQRMKRLNKAKQQKKLERLSLND